MKKIILLSLFLLVSVFVKAADDPAIHTKEFKDALTYLVAYNLYWHIWGFTDSEFNYDPNAGGWKVYPHLGKTIHGEVEKQGNKYLVYFESLPYGMNTYSIIYTNGIYKAERAFLSEPAQIHARVFDLMPKEKPFEVLSDDYEFKLPANYIEIASKFGKDTAPIVEKLKRSLKTLINELNDAEAGTHHLYIGPFSNYIFPGMKDLFIYWKEGEAFIMIDPSGSRDVADWDVADYYIDTFKFTESLPYRNHPEDAEATYLEEKQWETRWRVFWVNIKIANCVRDGVMVTIEKTKLKPPDKK